MELFERAKTVRLRSHHDKYLYADEDEAHVNQDRNASSPNARWQVEPVPHSPGVLRLRSRYGRYLSASNEPFMLGATGRKVLQTLPHRLDSSVEWVPDRDGCAGAGHAGRRVVRLRTRYGNFLRANAGLPPWRNSVTHDVAHRHAGWVVWDVEIIQVLPPPGPDDSSSATGAAAAAAAAPPSYRPPSRSPSPGPAPLPTSALMRPPPMPHHHHQHLPEIKAQPPPPPPGYIGPPAAGFARLESAESFSVPLHKVEGRMIHYHVGDTNGNVGEGEDPRSFTFNGTSLEELQERLLDETGIEDLIICSRSPINGKLLPLRLQLPPNNAAMHIVLVRKSSRVAKTFPWPKC